MWSFLDNILLFGYLVLLIGLGYFFSKKNCNSMHYFLGEKRIPAWVAACSIYITGLSSISYIAITANVYQSGWIFGIAALIHIPLVIFIAKYFIPFIRRINCITAYQYLEARFDRSMRLFASLIFILFHIMRIAIVIFIPILAFKEIAPQFNPLFAIALLGVLCILYTTIGGFEAVVWTDALQTIVLVSASVFVILYGWMAIPPSVNGFETLIADGKVFPAENFSFDPSLTTVWWILIGAFFSSIYQYIGSQDVVQKYNSTKNLHEAQKTLYMQIPLLFVSTCMFIGMGSALYLFYKFSGVSAPELHNYNAILPYFVIKQMPPGLSGLVIAGIIAAAQSTVSSSINSASTCATIDFIVPINPKITDQEKMTYAQIISWIVGILGISFSMIFTTQGQNNIYILFNAILGLLGAPIASVFLLGIFSNRVGSSAAWIGLSVSICVALYLGNPGHLLDMIPGYQKPEIFEFLFAPILIVSCMVPAYIATLFMKLPSEDKIKGLTYSSLIDLSDIQ